MDHRNITIRRCVTPCRIAALLTVLGCGASSSTSPGGSSGASVLVGTYVLQKVNGVPVPTMIVANNSLRMVQDSILSGTMLFQPEGSAGQFEIKLAERPNTITGGPFVPVQNYDDTYTISAAGGTITYPAHGLSSHGADSSVVESGTYSADGSSVTIPIVLNTVLNVNGSTTYGVTVVTGYFVKED